MAGAGWKDFVPGEVLSAANVQDYLQDQSVMVFASAAARTSALASPSEGMVSYLKDTDTVERFDGSSWVVPFSVANGGTGATTVAGAQDSLRVGLVPISPSSVAQAGGSASANTLGFVTFTGVTSLSLNGVFSSAYINYRLVISTTGGSVDGEIRFRYRSAGVDATASNYGMAYNAVRINGTTGTPSGNATYGFLCWSSTSVDGGYGTAVCDVFSPQVSSSNRTTVFSSGGNNGVQAYSAGMSNYPSASFDGLTIYPISGSISGTIQVFGYNE